MQTTTTTGNPGLRQGFFYGVIVGIVYLIVYAGTGIAHLLTIGGISSYVFTILIYILAIVAGVTAAAKTGKVTSGLVAGLFVGLIGTVLGSVGAIIFDYFNLDKLVNLSNQAIQSLGGSTHETGSQYLTAAVVGSIIVIVINTLIGLGLGALGGLIGRGRAPKPAPALYQDSLYTGNLAPTAPIYPPQQPQQPQQPQAGYPPQQPQGGYPPQQQ